MMSGLVIKAGLGYLREEDKEALLDIMVEAKLNLQAKMQRIFLCATKSLEGLNL